MTNAINDILDELFSARSFVLSKETETILEQILQQNQESEKIIIV